LALIDPQLLYPIGIIEIFEKQQTFEATRKSTTAITQ
jgi:hypothetical protein